MDRLHGIRVYTYLHLNEFPRGLIFSNLGGGLLDRCLRTQSMRNCLGDFPVHCCLVYSKLRTFAAATTVTVFPKVKYNSKSQFLCICSTQILSFNVKFTKINFSLSFKKNYKIFNPLILFYSQSHINALIV